VAEDDPARTHACEGLLMGYTRLMRERPDRQHSNNQPRLSVYSNEPKSSIIVGALSNQVLPMDTRPR